MGTYQAGTTEPENRERCFQFPRLVAGFPFSELTRAIAVVVILLLIMSLPSDMINDESIAEIERQFSVYRKQPVQNIEDLVRIHEHQPTSSCGCVSRRQGRSRIGYAKSQPPHDGMTSQRQMAEVRHRSADKKAAVVRRARRFYLRSDSAACAATLAQGVQ